MKDNNGDEKEGVVIDVEPELEPDVEADEKAAGETDAGEQAATEAAGARPKSRSGGGAIGVIGIVLALLALLGLGALGAYGYKQMQQFQAGVQSLETRLASSDKGQQSLVSAVKDAGTALAGQTEQVGQLADEFKRQLGEFDAQKQAFAKQEKLLADERIRMEEREAELRATVSDVHQRMGRSGKEWMVAESEYLIRLALQRLRLAGDVGAAKAALQTADQRLLDTGDPGWAGVREQIARDIAALDVLDVPDLAGLSARLAALSAEVPKLKLTEDTGAQPARPALPAVAGSDDGGDRGIGKLASDLWSGVKNSVRIRRHDKPVQAMLAPQHQFFLYENLRLQIETARLALARGDQALYSDSLKRAHDWIGDYFKPEDATTVALQTALTELSGRSVKPNLPDISNSLRALRARLRLLARIGDIDRTAPAAEPQQ